jgi:excisionase family DNA binding protein
MPDHVKHAIWRISLPQKVIPCPSHSCVLFITAKEAAVYLGGRCNHETVHTLIYKGELKAKKVGREWRIMPEWLDEYMNKPDNIQPGPSVTKGENE